MKSTIKHLTVEELLHWVEWKGIDIQYDLFNENKFKDDPRFDKFLNIKNG